MAIYSQAAVSSSYVKVQWKEQYVSSALDAKLFGISPPGTYQGFTIGPGTNNGRDVVVGPGSVSGNVGSGVSANYSLGAYDSTLGYSIGVYQDPSGFSTSVQIPPNAGLYHLDATGLEGQTVYVVMYVNYAIGQNTTCTFALVNGAQIDANPWYIVLGYVQVPLSPATPLSGANFGYYDPVYPRTTPAVTSTKTGLMTPSVLASLQAGNVFPWNAALTIGVDPNNAYNVTITPSQGTYNNIRYYTYVSPNISSRFPRSSTGAYNGGPSDSSLTNLNLLSGTIGGAHQVVGNTTFSIPSVSGVASSYQVGIVALDTNDNLSVTYGSIFSSLSGAMLDANLPTVSSSLMQIGGFVASTNGAGQLNPLATVSGSIFWRRPFLNLGGGGSSSVSGTVAPSTSLVIADNISIPQTVISVGATSGNFGVIRYGISRNGVFRRGNIDWAQDGTSGGISVTDTGPTPTNSADVGVSFAGAISGSNFLIQYTSSSLGVSGLMIYDSTVW